MSHRLDELLKSMNSASPTTPDSALDRARAAMARELALKQPVRRWRTEVRRVLLAIWGLALLVAGGGLLAGVSSPKVLLARAPLMLALAVVSGLSVVGALSPRASVMDRLLGGAATLLSAAWLVFARAGTAAVAGFPEWVCTVSHLGAGLLPLGFAWAALRNTAPDPLRTVLVGLGVGATGALIGELACEQGMAHVATYHLGAWGAITVLALLLSRFVPRKAFAP